MKPTTIVVDHQVVTKFCWVEPAAAGKDACSSLRLYMFVNPLNDWLTVCFVIVGGTAKMVLPCGRTEDASVNSANSAFRFGTSFLLPPVVEWPTGP